MKKAFWIIMILGIIAVYTITGMESVKAGFFNILETITSSIVY